MNARRKNTIDKAIINNPIIGITKHSSILNKKIF